MPKPTLYVITLVMTAVALVMGIIAFEQQERALVCQGELGGFIKGDVG